MSNTNVSSALDIYIRSFFDGKGIKLADDEFSQFVQGLKEHSASAKSAGAHVGEQAGEGMSEALEHHLKTHVANMIGSTLGAPGLGRLAAMGLGGAIGAIGLGITEHVGEFVGDKLKEIRETYEALGNLSAGLGQSLQFSPELLHQLHEVAEGLSTAKIKTAEWLGVMDELRRAGAGGEALGPITGDVATLTTLLGGDAKQAAEAFSQALEGNYDGLRRVGIVVQDGISSAAALQSIHESLAARITVYGNAAVSASRNVRELAEANKAVAKEFEGIKDQADAAAKAIASVVDELEQTKSDKVRELDAKEKQELAKVDKDFASGAIKTQEEADAKRAKIHEDYAKQRRNVEHETAEQQAGRLDEAQERERAQMDAREAQQKKLEADVEKAAELERRRTETKRASVQYQEALQAASNEYAGPRERDAVAKSQGELNVARMHEAEMASQLPPDIRTKDAATEALNRFKKEREQADKRSQETIDKYVDQKGRITSKEESSQRVFETESQTRGIERDTKGIEDRKARIEHLESEAAEYTRRDASRPRGTPHVEMPEDLRGVKWSYDFATGKAHITAIQQAAQHVEQMGASTAHAMERVAKACEEMARKAGNAAERVKNSGERLH